MKWTFSVSDQDAATWTSHMILYPRSPGRANVHELKCLKQSQKRAISAAAPPIRG